MSIASYLMKQASRFFSDSDLRKENQKLARDVEWYKGREEQLSELAADLGEEIQRLSIENSKLKQELANQSAAAFGQFGRLLHLISMRLMGMGIKFSTTLARDGEKYCLKDGIKIILSSQTVITLFCELIGLSKEEEFWANLNAGWEACLRSRLGAKKGENSITRKDDFSDLPGHILRSDGCCGIGDCPGKMKS